MHIALIRAPFLALTALASLLLLPMTAEAGLVQCTGLDCNYCTFIDTLFNVLNWLKIIAAFIAAMVIMYGGFKMLTSAGDQSGYQDGKKFLTNAIIGLIVLMAAVTLVDVLIQALVRDDSADHQSIRLRLWHPTGDCGGLTYDETEVPDDIDADDSELPPEDGTGGSSDPTTCNGVIQSGQCHPVIGQDSAGCMTAQCYTSDCATRGGIFNAETGQCVSNTPTPPAGGGGVDTPIGCPGIMVQGHCVGSAVPMSECTGGNGMVIGGVCYSTPDSGGGGDPVGGGGNDPVGGDDDGGSVDAPHVITTFNACVNTALVDTCEDERAACRANNGNVTEENTGITCTVISGGI